MTNFGRALIISALISATAVAGLIFFSSTAALQTIPVVQSLFQSQFSANYNVAFSSYLMAMAPTVVAYLFSQRWVMSSLTRGAIKG